LYARDGIHANHAGAFFTANIFAAVLFDLHTKNIPPGNVVDNLPMLNVITLAGFVFAMLFKRPMMAIVPLLLKIMSFFPHVFIFTESGNRILLLYAVIFILLAAAVRRPARLVLACAVIIYYLSFTPAPLYRADDAHTLAQTAWDFHIHARPIPQKTSQSCR